ncbi:MAG: helix-turn-helix domain-containing protein [Candidatus Binatia bacterium]
MSQNRVFESGQLLNLLGTAVAQAKEAVVITSAQLESPGPLILFINPALRSAIEFTVIHCAGAVIQADDLPPEIFQPADVIAGDPLDEKLRFLQALDRSRSNRSLAARFLGISRATLYRRLADLKINPVNS